MDQPKLPPSKTYDDDSPRESINSSNSSIVQRQTSSLWSIVGSESISNTDSYERGHENFENEVHLIDDDSNANIRSNQTCQNENQKEKMCSDFIGRVPAIPKKARSLTVYGMVSGIKKYMGWGETKKKVHFPEEVINESEVKGDIAGKERFVPRVKQPYRKPKTRKKGSLVSPQDTEFRPYIPEIMTEELKESCWERMKCCRRLSTEELIQETPKERKTLRSVAEGVFYCVLMVDKFINGHQKTFAVAEQAINLPETEEQQKVALSPDFLTSASANEHINNLLHVPSTSSISLLTIIIWVFAYCVPQLFEDMTGPSETDFWCLMTEFGELAAQVEEETSNLLLESADFYHFAFECVRITQTIQTRLKYEADITIKKPLTRGCGLKLLKIDPKEIAAKPKVIVQLGKLLPEENNTISDWTNFSDVSCSERIRALKQLLDFTAQGYSLLQRQIKQLVEDIIESTCDIANKGDILFNLVDMYDRVNFIATRRPTKEKARQLEILKAYHMEFYVRLQEFIMRSQFMMEKAMEIRDMFQVACTYLVKECEISLVPKIIPQSMYKLSRNCCSCGIGGSSESDPSDPEHIRPLYKAQDLFRTYYQEATKDEVPFLPAGKLYLNLMHSTTEKMKRPGKRLNLKFSSSDHNIQLLHSLSDVLSDKNETDDLNQPEVQELKPILVKHSLNTEVPETEQVGDQPPTEGAPRTSSSGQQSVEVGNVEADVQNEEPEEEDEPIINSALARAHTNSVTRLTQLKETRRQHLRVAARQAGKANKRKHRGTK